MDNSWTVRRLQAFVLLGNGPDASDEGLPDQLDCTASRHLRSGSWEGLRGLSHIADHGEKQMAESFSGLRSDNR